MSDKTMDWKTRWQSALIEQHALLFDYITKSIKFQFAETVNCPVCDSSRAALFFEKDWFQYVKCQDCSMVYMNPRMNRAATHAFYNSNVNAIYNETKFDQVSSSTELDDRINFGNLKLIDKFRCGEKGTLLEVGSAKGFFLSKAREMGYRIYGLELNQANYKYSREKLGDTILNVDLADAKFEDKKFDVVYMRDLIEHIPTPKSFLNEIGRITKPGGIVFVETHNIEGWIYKITRERHTVIFGFEHPNHWSPRTLAKALAQHGFAVREVVHVSLDFTLRAIMDYLTEPGFTTVYPQPVGRGIRLFVRILRKLFSFKVIRWPDSHTLPYLANLFRRGSIMKVIAQKLAN